MPEILTSEGYRDDPWRPLADDASLDQLDDYLILSLAQARELPAARRPAHWGLRLGNTEDIESLEDELLSAALIALEFPAFGDGRAYSQARLLRERRGYRGSLRACGDVLRDQLFYMRRCGFDQFAVGTRLDAEAIEQAFGTFSVSYQPTGSRAGA